MHGNRFAAFQPLHGTLRPGFQQLCTIFPFKLWDTKTCWTSPFQNKELLNTWRLVKLGFHYQENPRDPSPDPQQLHTGPFCGFTGSTGFSSAPDGVPWSITVICTFADDCGLSLWPEGLGSCLDILEAQCNSTLRKTVFWPGLCQVETHLESPCWSTHINAVCSSRVVHVYHVVSYHVLSCLCIMWGWVKTLVPSEPQNSW